MSSRGKEVIFSLRESFYLKSEETSIFLNDNLTDLSNTQKLIEDFIGGLDESTELSKLVSFLNGDLMSVSFHTTHNDYIKNEIFTILQKQTYIFDNKNRNSLNFKKISLAGKILKKPEL